MQVLVKACSSCKKVKLFREFHRNQCGKYDYESKCKICSDIVSKKWYLKNRDKIIEKGREYARLKRRANGIPIRTKMSDEERKKRARGFAKRYAANNKEKVKLSWKDYHEKNKDNLNAQRREKYSKYSKEKKREGYLKNKEAMLLKSKEWRNNNRERVRAMARKRMARITNTIQGRLDSRMRTGINQSLRQGKRGARWEVVAGYTVEKLKRCLEKQFTDEMSWDAFMGGQIHIDHIKPINNFKYVSIMDEQFRQCWALSNLQPLWAKDNILKSNKY